MREHVEAAADQIRMAAGDPVRLRAALMYWFGALYDEGQQRIVRLGSTVRRLREMNRRLELQDQQDSEPPPEG